MAVQVVEPEGEVEFSGGQVSGSDEADHGVLNLGREIGKGKGGEVAGHGVEFVEAELIVGGTKARCGKTQAVSGAVGERGIEVGGKPDSVEVVTENAIEQSVQSGKLRWVQDLRNVDGALIDEALEAAVLERLQVLLYVAQFDGLEVDCHDATLLIVAC